MRRPAMLLVSLVLALSAVSWTAPAPDVTAQGYSPDSEELAFVDLLNGYRGSLGLGAVSLNYQLGAAADYHSYDMGTYNYFAHSLSDGSDAGTNIRNFGYTGSSWAENIAAGMSTAQEAFTSWQNSPEHNATMTDPSFSEVGVGRAYIEGSQYGWYWTATYGGGAPVAAAPVADPGVAPDPSITTDPTLLTNNGAVETTTTTLPEPIYVSDGAANIDTSSPETTIVYDDGGERKGGHKKRNRNGANQQQAAVELPQEAVELPQNAVNADGDHAAATGANPVANGAGDTVIYGDINTGGVQGETIVYEPPSLTVSGEPAAPAYTSAPPAETVTTVETAPTQTEKVYSEPNFTESVSTNIETNDGNGQALGG
jgi:uncharacterized protein YkwD